MEHTLRQRRLRQCDRQMMKCVGEGLLLPRGFVGPVDRTFLRRVSHEGTITIQIVEFQIGAKHLAGRFTVNLAVHNPDLQPSDWPKPANGDTPAPSDCFLDLTQRLGFFVKPRQSLLSRLLMRPSPSPTDHWWKQSPDESRMRKIMEGVRGCLESDGLTWLERHTCRAAFTWAAEELARRKRWKESRGALPYVPTVSIDPSQPGEQHGQENRV